MSVPAICRKGSAWALVLLLPSLARAQSYTWRNVEIVGGGFVPGIVFSTAEPDLIYARTDIGGAYRWNPATRRWVQLLNWVGFDDWNLTGVDSLATDPVDPGRLYILAGTYTNDFAAQNGAILRSTDRGATFTRINLPFKSGGNMPGRNMGERLAIDPNRNATLYLGTRSGNGLWRSTDFGSTWARVTSFPATGTYVQDASDPNHYLSDPIGVTWVLFDKSTGSAGSATQTIYVGVADLGTSIYRSTNGGATWAAVPGQPTGFLPHHAVLSNGTLYVTYSNKGGPYDGEKGDVWKLSTATGAWTLISPIPSTSADDYFGYGGLAVDAQAPETLMVSALNSWWPDTILFRSTNGGATWTRIWEFTSYPSRSLRYVQDITAAPWLVFTDTNPQPPVPSPKLGWMVGDLEIDPFNSNRMMYGTGATLYGAEDLGLWDTGGQIHVKVMAQGIEETAILSLISPPSGAPLISGIGDINGFRHDSLTVVPQRMVSTPSFAASSLDFAELSPGFVVRVGNVNRTDNPTVNRAGLSFDGGSNWFQASSEPAGTNGGGSVAAAADASRVLWAPPGATPSVSTNSGSSWTASTGLPSGAVVGSDRVNPMKFYGFAGGTFYSSSNGGATFAAGASTGLPASAQFKAVPGHEGDVWLAGGSETGAYGLWHSTNGGSTFTRNAGLEEADNVGLGMPAPGQSYPALYSSAQAGGVRGIYRSTDAGATWTRINDDQHQFASTGGAITGDPRVFGRVYLSTNGLGIVYGEPAGSTTPDFALAAAPNSLVVSRGASGTSTVSITRSGGFAGSVAFAASGLPAGVTASFSPASTTGANATLTLAASATAATGPATVTVTGTGGSLTRTAAIGLTIAAAPTPDFALAASPSALTAAAGGSGASTVSITRSGGFTGAVAFTASGLPAGVTATFAPASATGTSSVLTLAAAPTAAAGTSTVAITGTSGTLVRTTSVSLTVTAAPAPDFALASSPAALTVAAGASGTSTVSITRSGGFTGAVAFTASGLPAGVTAAFAPTSTTGASAVLTLSAGPSAAAGTSTVTITGTGGSRIRTATVALTVTTGGGGTGGVTPTAVVTSSSPWFNEEQLRLANTGTLTALSVTIVVQRTAGVAFGGQYNTVGGTFTQASSTTATAVTFTFTLNAGQTLSAGSGRTFAAQTSGSGTAHPTAGDTFTVSYTTGGATFTQAGHF